MQSPGLSLLGWNLFRSSSSLPSQVGAARISDFMFQISEVRYQIAEASTSDVDTDKAS